MNTARVTFPSPFRPAIKRILYATDFSDASAAAQPIVSALAKRYGAELYAAHISPLPSPVQRGPDAASAMESKIKHECEAEMMKLVVKDLGQGFTVKQIIQPGTPAVEIQRIVENQYIDLVVSGTHGKTGFRHMAMGSVTEDLLRNLPCPVLSVSPNLAKRFQQGFSIRKVLIPTDLSKESLVIAPYATLLAKEYQAEITVLHVLPPETAENPVIARLAEPLRKEMERIWSSQFPPECRVQFVLAAGEPAETIAAHARSMEADLIAFGVRRRSKFVTHLSSTILYRAILGSECPVLSYRL